MLKIMVIVVTEGRFSCKICMIQTRFSNFILIIINHFKRLEEKQIRCPIFDIKTEKSVPVRWEFVRHGSKRSTHIFLKSMFGVLVSKERSSI